LHLIKVEEGFYSYLNSTPRSLCYHILVVLLCWSFSLYFAGFFFFLTSSYWCYKWSNTVFASVFTLYSLCVWFCPAAVLKLIYLDQFCLSVGPHTDWSTWHLLLYVSHRLFIYWLFIHSFIGNPGYHISHILNIPKWNLGGTPEIYYSFRVY
jgi:hypothetical protein